MSPKGKEPQHRNPPKQQPPGAGTGHAGQRLHHVTLHQHRPVAKVPSASAHPTKVAKAAAVFVDWQLPSQPMQAMGADTALPVPTAAAGPASAAELEAPSETDREVEELLQHMDALSITMQRL
jgi:hypothetical protein